MSVTWPISNEWAPWNNAEGKKKAALATNWSRSFLFIAGAASPSPLQAGPRDRCLVSYVPAARARRPVLRLLGPGRQGSEAGASSRGSRPWEHRGRCLVSAGPAGRAQRRRGKQTTAVCLNLVERLISYPLLSRAVLFIQFISWV